MSSTKDPKLTKNELATFGIFILLFVVLLIIVMNSQSKGADKKASLYPQLHKYQSIEGRIKSISRERYIVDNSRIYIDFINEVKFSLGGSGYNRSSSLQDFTNFIQSGDSLIKRYGSDTVHIHRGEQRYYFVLDDVIN
ncbi:hypothetical protein [Dysgonomonas macrotermitis]|uniref:Uncharacterized protein n=1 Tax=Dysgonomonas macrotermitis TaxID=1346286 RepID=A0A1M4YDJ9_9BACT|nr:hypothetical protein [Dysgonomonas macrotermitis]SHF03809.1 hypothetical protein SAMN05444362_103141 [Dysgonomonas macrotermitis]